MQFSRRAWGAALVSGTTRTGTPALPAWDCDIVELHHVHKLDSPSGIALALGACAGEGRAQSRYATPRARDVVDESVVQFTDLGEWVELIHRETTVTSLPAGRCMRRPGLLAATRSLPTARSAVAGGRGDGPPTRRNVNASLALGRLHR